MTYAAAAVVGGGALLGGAAGLAGRDKKKNLTSTSQTVSEPWQPQQPYLQYGFEQAKSQYQQPRQYYSGQTYASPSEATQLGLQKQQDRATQGSAMLNAGRDQNLATINGNYLNADSNPYLQSAIDNANKGTIRGFNNSVIPQLQSSFAMSGRYGSGAQQGQQGVASQDLLNQLGTNAQNISYGNYADERNRQSEATQNAPAYAQADYNDIASLLDVGQQREAITQQGIDEAMNRFNFSQNAPREDLASYMGLIQGNYGGTSTTTDTQRNPNYKSAGSALLGGGMQGAGMGASLLGSYGQYQQGQAAMNKNPTPSDKNLKENIKKVGEENGFNIYEFNYINKPNKRYKGVMAQDVLKIIPEAVVKMSNGFLAVCYDMIGLKMEEIA